jgi:hypothetical protein
MQRDGSEQQLLAQTTAEQVKAWIKEICPMPEKQDIDLVIVSCPTKYADTEVTVYWKNHDQPTSKKLTTPLSRLRRDDLVHVSIRCGLSPRLRTWSGGWLGMRGGQTERVVVVGVSSKCKGSTNQSRKSFT